MAMAMEGSLCDSEEEEQGRGRRRREGRRRKRRRRKDSLPEWVTEFSVAAPTPARLIIIIIIAAVRLCLLGTHRDSEDHGTRFRLHHETNYKWKGNRQEYL